MNIVTKMVWILILLTTTLCAAVIKDPTDRLGDVIGDSSVTESDEDLLYDILNDLVKELKHREETRALNKIKPQEIDQLLNNLEYYIQYKKTEKLNRVNDTSDLVEQLKENIEELDGEEENRMSSELDDMDHASALEAHLRGLFEYIDTNIAEILDELIYEFRREPFVVMEETYDDRLEKTVTSSEFRKEIDHMEDIIYTALTADTMAQASEKILRRTSKDTPKEAPFLDVDIKVEPTQKNYDDLNMKLMYEKRGGTCTLINGYSKTPIYVISTCRLGFTRSRIWELCEHRQPFSARLHQENIIDITKTPVQDEDGFVYANVYCAQCNDVSIVRAWTTKIDCEHMQPLSLSDGTDQITLMKEFTDQTMGCARRLTPAIPRMIHQCSHIDVINTMRYHVTRVGDGGYKTDSSPFPLSFSILMNFGFDGKTHFLFATTSNSQSTSIACSSNEKYDPQFQKCRQMVCYDGYELVDGQCIKTGTADLNPEPDDLINLQTAEEPYQIILTLKNITYGNICILFYDGIEDLIIYNLGNMFNISETRISNLTVDLVNSTQLANRTGDSIEVLPFTTPPASKLATHIDHSKQIGKVDSSANKVTTTPTMVDKVNTNTGTTRLYNVYEDHNTNNGGHTVSDAFDSIDLQINNGTRHQQGNVSMVSENNSGGYLKVNQNDTNQLVGDGNGTKGHGDGLDHIPDTPVCAWAKYSGLSVRISFILNPAPHKNRTILEKSVETVVQTMSDLVHSNSFMLSINGTDFKVQGVENTPQGSSLEDFCKKGVHHDLDQSQFDIIPVYDNQTEKEIIAVEVKDTGQRYYPGQYDVSVNIDGNVGNLNQTVMSYWGIVCDMPKIADKKCGRVALMKGEYQVLQNKSIWFVNRTYSLSEYEYANEMEETVRICTPPDWVALRLVQDAEKWTLACGEDLIKLVIAESYLSFILGIVSLVSMLSVLITYGLFEKLRNLPGMNTMNLTFSLFMGELVFIASGYIQPQQAWLCSAVGVLLHYLFLASFFWMNVMAFDVFRTFGNKCILTRVRNKKKYLPRYMIYAWGCPLIIVTFCAVVDFTDLINGLDIGYGGSSVADADVIADVTNSTSTASESHVYRIGCWIQQPVASMVAFGGPMILILFSNAIMFIRTIICIRASTRDARSSVRRPTIKRMTGRDDVMLYVRISTVMGFTWIFGLASSLISAFAGPTSRTICITLHLLGLLFIVFNCSQGIFIFFAFVINRRVLAMFRELFVRLKTGRARQLSTSSSRGTLTTAASQSSLSHIT